MRTRFGTLFLIYSLASSFAVSAEITTLSPASDALFAKWAQTDTARRRSSCLKPKSLPKKKPEKKPEEKPKEKKPEKAPKKGPETVVEDKDSLLLDVRTELKNIKLGELEGRIKKVIDGKSVEEFKEIA